MELDARGIDLQRVQELWGVKLAYLRQPQVRLPAFLARRFWEVAVELSGDPAIGLHAARQSDPGQMLGLVYLMQLMPSRLAALQTLARYWPLMAGHLDLECTEQGGRLHVALLPTQAMVPAPEELDFWGALQVRHLRGLPGTTNALCELRMRRPAPEDPTPWTSLPVNSLHFGSARDEVVLDIDTLRQERPAGSPAVCTALQGALEHYAEQTSRALLLEAVANTILASLAQEPNLEQVAEQLHSTSRTLHRALQREGWSFNAMVEAQRRYLAIDLMRTGELSVSEVAERLGYREVSNFIRAFRRWYQISPGAIAKT